MTWVGIAVALLGLYFLWRFGRAVLMGRKSSQASVSEKESRGVRRVHLPGPQSPLKPVVLLVPAFPFEEPAIQMVESFEGDGPNYQTDLSLLTCTCPDFVKRRSQFPGRGVRRVCKHLYVRFPPAICDTFDPLLQAFLSERHPSPYLYQAKIGENNVVLLGVTPGEEWLNVFTRRRRKGETPGNFTGEYKRYGFSVERNGWAYGNHPAGAHEIRQLIAYFVSDRPFN